jgi:hypothetical protein
MHVPPSSLPLYHSLPLYLSTSNSTKRYACTAYLFTSLPLYLFTSLPLYLSNSLEGYACTTYLFTSLPLYLSTSLPSIKDMHVPPWSKTCKGNGEYTLHPTPYTLHPTPYTLHPKSSIPNPKPEPRNHRKQRLQLNLR